MPGNWNHTPTQDHTALTQVQGTVSAGERSDPALNPPTQLSVLPFTDPERSEGDWDGEGGAYRLHRVCGSPQQVSVANLVSRSYLPLFGHRQYGT